MPQSSAAAEVARAVGKSGPAGLNFWANEQAHAPGSCHRCNAGPMCHSRRTWWAWAWGRPPPV